MGQSTDALLMFGVDLGDGQDIEWPDTLVDGEEGGEQWPDMDAWISKRAGLKQPQTKNYQDPAWSAFWDAKRKAEEACPVDLVSHCSGEYPMWILALRRTVQRASRGYPVTPVMGEVSDTEIAAMKVLCEEMGLRWSEPEWMLCSNWN